ncbi:MAG: hypothetical protein J0L51_07120 [Rhizobiales bacterium]|nr:hypothetical protein [Hyphomicrobiales bacterium]
MPLAKERNTIQIGDGLNREIGIKANVKIFAGALVVNDAGVAAPGRTATGLVAIGRAEQTVDNTGGADNAQRIRVRRGVLGFKNKSDDLVVAADIGKDCFVVDDETVAKTSATNTRSVAGKVFAIDGDTVYVDFM